MSNSLPRGSEGSASFPSPYWERARVRERTEYQLERTALTPTLSRVAGEGAKMLSLKATCFSARNLSSTGISLGEQKCSALRLRVSAPLLKKHLMQDLAHLLVQ